MFQKAFTRGFALSSCGVLPDWAEVLQNWAIRAAVLDVGREFNDLEEKLHSETYSLCLCWNICDVHSGAGANVLADSVFLLFLWKVSVCVLLWRHKVAIVPQLLYCTVLYIHSYSLCLSLAVTVAAASDSVAAASDQKKPPTACHVTRNCRHLSEDFPMTENVILTELSREGSLVNWKNGYLFNCKASRTTYRDLLICQI